LRLEIGTGDDEAALIAGDAPDRPGCGSISFRADLDGLDRVPGCGHIRAVVVREPASQVVW
jgi:hypothetical protein